MKLFQIKNLLINKMYVCYFFMQTMSLEAKPITDPSKFNFPMCNNRKNRRNLVEIINVTLNIQHKFAQHTFAE